MQQKGLLGGGAVVLHLQCHFLVARETMVLLDKKDVPELYWPEPVPTFPSLNAASATKGPETLGLGLLSQLWNGL